MSSLASAALIAKQLAKAKKKKSKKKKKKSKDKDKEPSSSSAPMDPLVALYGINPYAAAQQLQKQQQDAALQLQQQNTTQALLQVLAQQQQQQQHQPQTSSVVGTPRLGPTLASPSLPPQQLAYAQPQQQPTHTTQAPPASQGVFPTQPSQWGPSLHAVPPAQPSYPHAAPAPQPQPQPSMSPARTDAPPQEPPNPLQPMHPTQPEPSTTQHDTHVPPVDAAPAAAVDEAKLAQQLLRSLVDLTRQDQSLVEQKQPAVEHPHSLGGVAGPYASSSLPSQPTVSDLSAEAARLGGANPPPRGPPDATAAADSQGSSVQQLQLDQLSQQLQQVLANQQKAQTAQRQSATAAPSAAQSMDTHSHDHGRAEHHKASHHAQSAAHRHRPHGGPLHRSVSQPDSVYFSHAPLPPKHAGHPSSRLHGGHLGTAAAHAASLSAASTASLDIEASPSRGVDSSTSMDSLFVAAATTGSVLVDSASSGNNASSASAGPAPHTSATTLADAVVSTQPLDAAPIQPLTATTAVHSTAQSSTSSSSAANTSTLANNMSSQSAGHTGAAAGRQMLSPEEMHSALGALTALLDATPTTAGAVAAPPHQATTPSSAPRVQLQATKPQVTSVAPSPAFASATAHSIHHLAPPTPSSLHQQRIAVNPFSPSRAPYSPHNPFAVPSQQPQHHTYGAPVQSPRRSSSRQGRTPRSFTPQPHATNHRSSSGMHESTGLLTSRSPTHPSTTQQPRAEQHRRQRFAAPPVRSRTPDVRSFGGDHTAGHRYSNGAASAHPHPTSYRRSNDQRVTSGHSASPRTACSNATERHPDWRSSPRSHSRDPKGRYRAVPVPPVALFEQRDTTAGPSRAKRGPQFASSSRDFEVCDGCGTRQSSTFCVDCDRLLCASCDEDGHLLKVDAAHNRVPAEEAVEYRVYCREHHTHRIAFYCLHCETPVCAQCRLVGNHSSELHDCVDLEEAYGGKSHALALAVENVLRPKRREILDKLKAAQQQLDVLYQRARAIEYTTQQDTSRVLGRLRSAVSVQEAAALGSMHSLKTDLSGIDEFLQQVTQPHRSKRAMCHYLASFPQVSVEAERLSLKPCSDPVPVDVDTLPMETDNRLRDLQRLSTLETQVKSYAAVVRELEQSRAALQQWQRGFAIQHQQLQELRRVEKEHAQQMKELEVTTKQEMQEWIHLTDRFANELSDFKLRCRYCDVTASSRTVNSYCSANAPRNDTHGRWRSAWRDDDEDAYNSDMPDRSYSKRRGDRWGRSTPPDHIPPLHRMNRSEFGAQPFGAPGSGTHLFEHC